MTSLRCDGMIINLWGASSMQLGIELLERRYSTDTIHYYDIKTNYRPLPQVTPDDYARMARAFLLYILGAYLFANGGKMVSLRWLSFFRDFEEAQEANQGQACLAYLYSSLDMLSRGTLCQLVGPWKLIEVGSLILSSILQYMCFPFL